VSAHRNQLAGETSPYLLQHAGNPVDWRPWGEEAFELARALDRPVLLSVGYSACHWCHVMERESFEDSSTAQLMNDNFVSIKVDREERPDIDGLYMTAVVSQTGQGGWPMTVFLLPDGRPFYGGTYFPPEARGGLPSFKQVLDGIATAYTERREIVEQQASELAGSLQGGRLGPPAEGFRLAEGTLLDALLTLRGQYDERNGGFGRAPKFPPHSVLTFLLRMHRRTGSEEALAMALRTLGRMADGGIHDQLGGGFHRYAVDAIWLVPHFEQMLYDNALLARSYLAAWQVTGDERWRATAEGILDYLLRELALEHGGLASAQDADTDGVEGATFTWTPAQLRALLSPDDAELAERVWGVTDEGNFEGATVLSLVAPPEDAVERDRLAGIRATLLAARAARPQPALDDKALASWNGMALAALAEGARLCRRPDLLAAAERCAAFLLGPLSHPDGGLWRTHRGGRSQVPGFLDDYAQVAVGLHELYLATSEHRYLAESRRLALLACERFGAPDGSFFDTAHDAEVLVARPRELDDNPTPSGNTTLAGVLVKLARIYGEPELERRAHSVVAQVGTLLARAPQGFGHLLGVCDALLSPPREAAVVGARGDPALAELTAALLDPYEPDLAVAFGDGSDDLGVPLLTGRGLVGDRAAVYVCSGFVCAAPATDAHMVRTAALNAIST
jgi:uncharacterized protein YyaL (SSP411 family)